ncbi:hypothetical protein [Sphingomonas sp. MMS24-J13]
MSKTLIDPASASVIVVGDAAQFGPGLKEKGITAEVIPVAKLDLNKASLR